MNRHKSNNIYTDTEFFTSDEIPDNNNETRNVKSDNIKQYNTNGDITTNDNTTKYSKDIDNLNKTIEKYIKNAQEYISTDEIPTIPNNNIYDDNNEQQNRIKNAFNETISQTKSLLQCCTIFTIAICVIMVAFFLFHYFEIQKNNLPSMCILSLYIYLSVNNIYIIYTQRVYIINI